MSKTLNMKKLAFIGALVAAIFSLSSCEKFIDTLLKHYFIGNEVVNITSVEYEHGGLGDTELYTFHLYANEEKTLQYQFTTLKDVFSDEGMLVKDIVIQQVQSEKSKFTALDKLFSLEGKLAKDFGITDGTATSIEGTVKASIEGDKLSLFGRNVAYVFTDKDGYEVSINLAFEYIGPATDTSK